MAIATAIAVVAGFVVAIIVLRRGHQELQHAFCVERGIHRRQLLAIVGEALEKVLETFVRVVNLQNIDDTHEVDRARLVARQDATIVLLEERRRQGGARI